jgi:hypothetical protein
MRKYVTSALDGGERSASHPCRFTTREKAPGTHWIGGWMGPRTVLDTVVKRKISIPRRESNPRTPIVQPVAQRYTDWNRTPFSTSILSINLMTLMWLIKLLLSMIRAIYEGVSKSFRTESITKYTLTTINNCWEAKQRIMAAKHSRLTHKIALQLHLMAECSAIYSFRSRRPVRKLLVDRKLRMDNNIYCDCLGWCIVLFSLSVNSLKVCGLMSSIWLIPPPLPPAPKTFCFIRAWNCHLSSWQNRRYSDWVKPNFVFITTVVTVSSDLVQSTS